jgi:hypothetical protein
MSMCCISTWFSIDECRHSTYPHKQEPKSRSSRRHHGRRVYGAIFLLAMIFLPSRTTETSSVCLFDFHVEVQCDVSRNFGRAKIDHHPSSLITITSASIEEPPLLTTMLSQILFVFLLCNFCSFLTTPISVFCHAFVVKASSSFSSSFQFQRRTSPSSSPPLLLFMALDAPMESRLDNIRRSYQALTERLADPDVINDSSLLKQVMSDRAQSEEVVFAYEEYARLKNEYDDAKQLLRDAQSDDAELKEMAKMEIKDIEPQLDELEQKITVLLLPKDPNDNRNCMLEIRAGTGGSEANIFAGDLLDVYRKYISSKGWQATMIEASPGDDGGYKSVTLDVKGDSVYSKLKWEAGVHRVQRVPATESQGRVHTSTATVAIMPECDEVDVQIDPKDIELTTMRSGGAGGQVRACVREKWDPGINHPVEKMDANYAYSSSLYILERQ